jgi:signal peptidase II
LVPSLLKIGGEAVKYYFYWIALIVLVLDQISKKIIDAQLEIGERIKVLGDFFVITSIRNTGAAFSILQEQTVFFILITLAVVVGIVWYIHRNRNSGKVLMLFALGLILGGALGNFLDRALYGEVVDFLQFTFGSYVFPIFNIADTGITCGVILILLDTLLDMKKGEADASRDGAKRKDGQQHDSEHNEPVR